MFSTQEIYNISDEDYDEMVFVVVFNIMQHQLETGELGSIAGRKIRVKLLEKDIALLEDSYKLRAEEYKAGYAEQDLVLKIADTLKRKKEKLKGLEC
jgi:hypothetical protein